ncbi:ATP-binding protein [Xanthomonas sp. NCPPB 3583]|uniref:ATP-binding protein n=1 Tax=Xanthomonas sp. NCPPB 3583 TaxID=487558 RepID=UPI00355700A5
MSIKVGEVIAVHGVKITLRIQEESNKESLYYNGEKFKGISIREYISVQRGFRDIVCIVEGEYLDENRIEGDGPAAVYMRKVDVRPVGYFEEGVFKHGIKFLPMIRDVAFLLPERLISQIYGKEAVGTFVIGRTLKEEVPIGLPWKRLFNSHIGVFGNTGSGKSNTLTKLYTVLFDNKVDVIVGKSRFIVLDFNGEYTGAQLISEDQKTVLKLRTQGDQGDKFPLHKDEFWNAEMLSLLFQATPNTQKPFLIRLVEGRKIFEASVGAMSNYCKATFRRAFSAARPRPEALDLLRGIASTLKSESLVALLKTISWHSIQERFIRRSDSTYFDADGTQYDEKIGPYVEQLDLSDLDSFDQLIIRAYVQLTRELINGFVQFDHIQPLIKRMESSMSSLRRVLDVNLAQQLERLVTVISLKNCNNDVKKILPLLVAKHFYNQHKDVVGYPPSRTVHLIIDEAHNILSQQSSREQESWRDYRLELFEEIIKEGRKFGFFITIASQRPADISATIVSQLHNFFIHRLVNDRDLFLVDNALTTLDSLSRSIIPNLSQGCCVVTGTSFDIPMVLQVDELDPGRRPDSGDVDLDALWAAP